MEKKQARDQAWDTFRGLEEEKEEEEPAKESEGKRPLR